MTDVQKLLQEITERYESVDDLSKKVMFVVFKSENKLVDDFLKEFKEYQFEGLGNGAFVSKDLDKIKMDSLQEKINEYGTKNYKYIHDYEKDYYNKCLQASAYNFGLTEVVNAELKADKIEHLAKMSVYEKDLDTYHNKIMSPDFRENYKQEMVDFLSQVVNIDQFQKSNGVGLKELVDDIYTVASKVADRNIFDFSKIDNHGISIKFTIGQIAKKITKPNGYSNGETSFAFENQYAIPVHGFNEKAIADIIRAKYKDVDTIQPVKEENEITPLEEKMTHKFIARNPIMKGFTFSKSRQQYSEKNIFEVIVDELVKGAVNEVKVLRGAELHNTLKEASPEKDMYQLAKTIDEFMKGKINLKNDLVQELNKDKPLDQIVKKPKNKIKL
jgi:hypothetical protein